jgi:predicted MPP superfamily phosphohydrolase
MENAMNSNDTALPQQALLAGSSSFYRPDLAPSPGERIKHPHPMAGALAHPPHHPPADVWIPLRPGLRQLATPRGPKLQYFDAVGFEWNIYELAIHDLPDELIGYRIIHLSDLHCREYWQDAYDQLISRLHAEVPDVILVTGDYCDDTQHPQPALPICTKLLANLPSNQGMFGIFGNHDYNVSPADFRGVNIDFIPGRRVILSGRGGREVEVIGMLGPNREHLTPEYIETQPPRQPGRPRVMIGHYPDHIRRLPPMQGDIYLAGHTHGGQVCFPGGFPVIRHDSLPWRMCKGIHRYGHTWLCVSKGFGFSDVPWRMFCSSEVAELRLVRG